MLVLSRICLERATWRLIEQDTKTYRPRIVEVQTLVVTEFGNSWSAASFPIGMPPMFTTLAVIRVRVSNSRKGYDLSYLVSRNVP